MIDRVSIKVISGRGGDGCISGRKEKFVPRGGPDGGNGGNGGSVIVRCDRSISTLAHYRYKREHKATDGENGSSKKRHGKNGKNIEIKVPEGTVISIDDTKQKDILADLTNHGDFFVIARGGKGGKGNTNFSSSTNRYPLLAEKGENAEKKSIKLELKLLGDVGIIGLPNAGKSSLLAAITAASPKIATYPFSTIEPNLGVEEVRGSVIVFVDIPGLIEGANIGVGLGHEFLKHIQRTRLLVHVIDGSENDPVGLYRQIRKELILFEADIEQKPEIIVINKLDIEGVEKKIQLFHKQSDIKSIPIYLISALNRTGLDIVMNQIAEQLGRTKSEGDNKEINKYKEKELVEIIRPKPVDEKTSVFKEGKKFRVEHYQAERIAGMVDQSNWEANTQLYGYLKRKGVIAALERNNIKSGDIYILAGKEWIWE